MNAQTARAVNVVLGIWLFISAFLWAHAAPQFTNTWIVGLLIAVVAALGLRVRWAPYINAALAVWLFFSTWAMETIAMATPWNNMLVAVVVFAVSLVGSRTLVRTTTNDPGTPRPGEPAHRHHRHA